MLDISCELLDMTSIYTKYHEYHCLNRQIICFHVPVVQIWSVPKNSRKGKKLTKYNKKSKVIQIWERILKWCGKASQKMGQKNKKNKNRSPSAFVGTRGRGPSPSAGTVALGEEAPSPSVNAWHSGKRSPSPSARACFHSGKTFFNFLANDSIQCCRQMQISFCKCPSSPSVALGEGEHGFPRVTPFPRVPWVLQHSGKSLFPECPIFGTWGILLLS
jgi:hypothetical protein